ncbi:MAG: FcoT family thioesterase [Frankia sp.]
MADRAAHPAAGPIQGDDRPETGAAPAGPGSDYPDDPELVGQVLRPYREHCKYLKSAVARVTAGPVDEPARVGVVCLFEIPESCYIDDTGHFNSVEFNICYNQMLYFTLAKMVKESLVDPFAGWSMEDFWHRQLPNVLITDFRSSFRAPMSGRRFSGFLDITEIVEWEKNDLREALIVLRTECGYSDEDRGECQGDVTVAITNPPVRPASGWAAPGPAAAREALASLPSAQRRDELLDLVAAEFKTALLMAPADDLAPDANYFELGLTSLHVMDIKHRLEALLGRDVESAMLFNHPSLDAFVECLTTSVLADLFAAPPAADGPSSGPTPRQTLVDQLLKDLYPAE